MGELGKKEILEELEKLGIYGDDRNTYLKEYSEYHSSHNGYSLQRLTACLKDTFRKIINIHKKA
jgi:hypothetical protein